MPLIVGNENSDFNTAQELLTELSVEFQGLDPHLSPFSRITHLALT